MRDDRPSCDGFAVLYLSNADPTTSGGGYRRMFEEAKLLAERGHRATIIASRTDPDLPKYRWGDGVRIRTVKCVPDYLARFPLVYYYLSRSLFPLISAPVLLWVLLCQEYDVVIDNCSPHPSLAAFVARPFPVSVLALVHEYHDVTALSKYNVVVGMIQLLVQWVFRGDWYDGLVVPRETVADQFRRYGVTGPIHVVPNGIHLDKYVSRSSEERRRAGTNDALDVDDEPSNVLKEAPNFEDETPRAAEDTPDLVVVSRLVHRKGIDRLVRAVEQLTEARPDVTLTIVGDGPERARLEAMVAEGGLEDNVTFAGYVTERRKVELLNAAAVFVLPSQQEGFGIAVLEAMATATPVVVSDLQVLRTLVPQEGNAFVGPENADKLATALNELLGLPAERRREIGERNEQAAREYAWDRVADRVEQVYYSSIEEWQAGSSPQTAESTPNPGLSDGKI
jgi:glycosyltransferase involved in cell wall biosynthesis